MPNDRKCGRHTKRISKVSALVNLLDKVSVYFVLTFENVCSGLTFLALGNGAPDIFSQIAASVASPHGAEMALGKKKISKVPWDVL
jgi:Ca2+/Na+ antiporter